MIEKHLRNSFSLYLLLEILQLVHEVSSFSEVLYKRSVMKNCSKFTEKLKKQSSGGVLSKDVHKNFAKFTEQHLCRNLLKLSRAVTNLKLSEAATGDSQ